MSNLFRKISYRFSLRTFFKKVSFLLSSGKYFVGDKHFAKYQEGGIKKFSDRLRIIKIGDTHPYPHKYDSGDFFETTYKRGILTNDFAYFVFKDGLRFKQTKEHLDAYLNKLSYQKPLISFDEEKSMVILERVYGNHQTSEEYFALFCDYLLDKLRVQITNKIGDDRDAVLDKGFYVVQHGDCKNSNIIWNDYAPTMIDMEAIDLYPLFYDYFYYVFITKKESAISFLEGQENREKMLAVVTGFKVPRVPDLLDYYLSAYIDYWSGRIDVTFKKWQIDFYLWWVDKIELEKFPLCKESTMLLKDKIKFYKVK